MIWFGILGGILLVLAAVPYLVCLVLMRFLNTEGSPAQKADYEPTVSVVLPTYNEEAIIETRLENLLKLEYPSEKLDIIVVDSGTDETAVIARKFLANAGLNHTVIEENERRGVAAAVNLAVAEADGEIVFRTDCDSRVDADALCEAVGNFADPTIGAVTGRQSEVLGNSAVERDYRDLQMRLQQLESHLDSTFVVHGPCFLFRRSLFRELPHDSLADDTEIAVDVCRQGYRVVLDPAVHFTEYGTSAFGARRQRKDRRAMGLLYLLIRSRDLLGRHGLYGQFVLPMNVWMMWASPWLTAAGTICLFVSAFAFGPLALMIPIGLLIGGYLGQQEQLGVLQPVHALADSMVSLLIASVKLRKHQEGIWEIDQSSREVFQE